MARATSDPHWTSPQSAAAAIVATTTKTTENPGESRTAVNDWSSTTSTNATPATAKYAKN